MTNGNRYPGAMMLLLAILCLIGSTGCITVWAANSPPSVPDERIQLGMGHDQVEQLLRVQCPAKAFEHGTHSQCHYEDQSDSKVRAAFYFVAGPADLIFYPIERMIQNARKRWSSAVYDGADELIYFHSVDEDGETIIELGGLDTPLVITRHHTFLDAVLGPRSTYKGDDECEDCAND